MWDCLPAGLFLGGTSANLAQHAARLGAEATLLTAVGKDFLGDEALRRMEQNGVDVSFAHRHPERPTGTVGIDVSPSGEPTFTIHRERAWEDIPLTDSLLDVVRQADFLVYGSLVPHTGTSRTTLEALLSALPVHRQAVMDINFRPGFDRIENYQSLSRPPDLLKLNENELQAILRAQGEEAPDEDRSWEVDGALTLQRTWPARQVCLTRGERGAVYVDESGEVTSASAEAVKVRDTVGAGDAFLAALLVGLGESGDASSRAPVLRRACQLGAFVASKDGAVPAYDREDFPV